MFLLSLALFACASNEAAPDADGDGWAADRDCDDHAPGIHPGVRERCDGVDQDCDGVVDDDPVDGWRGYADRDGDGWGDDDAPLRYCAETPGAWAPFPGDCDDADAGSYPGAVETCGTPADDDCDGVANPPDAEGCETWWADADGDGAGGFAEACLCGPQEGWDATGFADCDDHDASRTEGCGLAGDHDIDELDIRVTGASRDFLGGTLKAVGDLTGDTRPDLGVLLAPAADCNCLQVIASPFEASRGLASAEILVAPDTLGDVIAVAPATDLDGDGVAELALVSAHKTIDRLEVYVLPTPLTGRIELDAEAPWIASDMQTSSSSALVVVDDADEDGAAEVVLANGGFSGGVWLFENQGDGELDLADAGGTVDLGAGCFATMAAPGDLDGDGADDLVVGDSCAVAVHFVLAVEVDGGDPVPIDRTLTAPGGVSGGWIQPIGDLDGDGRADVLVGGERTADEWVQWVVGDPALGADLDDAALATLVGPAGPASAADLDADGAPDLALGMYEASYIFADEVALVFGPLAGTIDLADAADARWRAPDDEYLGDSVLALERATADGRAGLWMGSPGADYGGVSSGALWFLPGGPR